MIRRFLPVLVLSLSLVLSLVGSAAKSATGDSFVVTISPSAVQPSSSRAYTIAITNRMTSSHSANNAHVAVPAGFVVDGASLTAATSSAGGCSGATWTATLDAISSTIDVVASADAATQLCPGGTLTVTFGAAAPAADGQSTWTTTLYLDSTGFSLTGSQPTVTVDSTPPPAPTLTSSPSDPSNSASPSFGFSDDDTTATFLCKLDSGAASPCTSPQPYSSLAEGPHTFTVTAVDPAGNESSATSFSWTIDLTPPPAPTITANPLSMSASTSASFSFGDDEATATFRCALDGGAASACTSPTSYSGLAEGPHTFTVTAVDAAGNESGAASYTWVIDVTAPSAPTFSSRPSDPSNSASPSFGFSDDDTTATFLCKLDSGAASACTSPKTYSGLVEGQHTFSVTAIDAAGNESSAASYTWVIDLTPPPAPTITANPLSVSASTSASFSFGDDEATATFRCALDGGAASACTSPTSYSGLAEGQHTFSVTAVDAAGNESVAASYRWVIDLTPPPAPTITSSPANVTASTSATFSFSDTEAAVAYRCRLDADAFVLCPSPISYDTLAEGSHTFEVKASDAAGNESTVSSFTWTIDLTNPVVTIDSASEPPKLTNHTDASFVFTSNKPNSTFACQLDDGAASACTSPKSYSGLGEGKHTFAVKAQDALGNTGLSTIWEWFVDSVPPKTTITRGPNAVSSNPSATFEFTSSEPVSGFACRLDGSAFAACSSPASYGGLADGQHTFSARATDLAGNTEPSPPSYSWQVSALVPPDTTPPGAVKDLKPKVAYGSLKLAWALPADLDFDHVRVVRTRRPSGTGATVVYQGKGSLYSDRHFQNDAFYRYAIRSYDHSGNASRAVSVDVKPSALLRSPADGAVVKAPPLLLWEGVAKATFYNVQLYRGKKKILSSWPVRARLQLKRHWRYQSHPFRLRKGAYRWYVWPGFGPPSKDRYGQLLGTGAFTVR